MAFSNISVMLATNAAKFKTEMAVAAAAVYGFGKATKESLDKIERVGTAMATAAIGVGVSMLGMAAVGVKAAMELETAMNNVATVWDEAGQKVAGTTLSLKDAGDQVLELSTELPQSASVLAGALYNVASSGFQGTEAMEVLAASAKAASAGLTTADVAVRGITAVMNAYGPAAGTAAHISDVLFQTVNVGVISFEELSAVMGDFVGTASAAGVSLEQANAALATMTLNGINASESSTSLSRVMQEFIKPSEELSALLQSMGYESGVMALEQEGLAGIIGKMSGIVGDSVENWTALFPEIRAVKGVLALLAGDGENYARVLGSLTDEAQVFEATQRALDKQSQSLGFQMAVLKNSVMALATELGQALLPFIKPIVAGMQALADGFNGIPDSLKKLIAVFGALAAIMVVVAGVYVLNRLQNLALQAVLKYTGVQALLTAKAMTILKVSMGVIGALVIAASAAMLIFGRDTGKAKAEASDLKGTLDEVTGAVTDGTKAWVRDKAVKEGWTDDAAKLGIAASDLTLALLGDAGAIERVNAAIVAGKAVQGEWYGSGDQMVQGVSAQADAAGRLEDGLQDTSAAIKTQTEAVQADAAATNLATGAIDALATAEQKETEAAFDRAQAHITALAAIQAEVDGVFDVADAYKAASASMGDTDQERTASADRERQRRAQDNADALRDEIDAEKDAAAERADVRRDALDDQLDAETKAFEQANAAHERGVADRRRAEDDAIADSLRAQRNGFDDMLRAQRNFHDDAMENLRDATDKEVEAENDAWAVRKQVLLNLIDDTFGAEREAAQALLATEEDAHEDRVDVIEETGDQLVRSETQAFDDRARAQEQGYDDMVDGQADALADRRRIEDVAWDDLVALDAEKLDDRHKVRRDDLDRVIKDEDDESDARHDARVRALDRLQEDEDAAATERNDKAKAKIPVTMAAIQDEVDAQIEKRRQMNKDLATLATEGGELVNSSTLTKMAEMGPEAVRVMASSGTDSIRALATSINAGMTPEELAVGKAQFDGQGRFIGTGLKEGIIAGAGGAMEGALAGITAGGVVVVVPPAPAPYGVDVRQHATGGFENHVAQVAAGGSWRLWAEPETGGEAYIPLAVSKRSRSTSILAQVAGQFGYGLMPMSAGGVLGGGAASGTMINMPIHVEARVAAGVDTDAVGRAIATQVERGVRTALDTLGRQVTIKAWRA
jgi:TP901 family phage tail tape measure protein